MICFGEIVESMAEGLRNLLFSPTATHQLVLILLGALAEPDGDGEFLGANQQLLSSAFSFNLSSWNDLQGMTLLEPLAQSRFG